MKYIHGRLVHTISGVAVILAAFALGSGGCASGGEANTTSNPTLDASSEADVGVGGSGFDGAAGSSGTGGTAGAAGDAAVDSDAADAASDALDDSEASVDGGADSAVDAPPDAPCSQNAETCNGLDDNCNGVIDEGDPGGGGVCVVPGKSGVCTAGTLHCINGTVSCVQDVQPASETCNGLDDNCDGQIDEGNPGGNEPCNTGKFGVCAAGTTACVKGSIECQQNTQPTAEVCNGLDDNCNDKVDEGFAGSNKPCTVKGQPVNSPCAQGLTNCLGGQNGCTQTVFPKPEVCDGKDDDCDGTIDNGLSGLSCSTGLPGVCASGKTQCSGGAAKCVPDIQPGSQLEVCDAKDDDCDGKVDNVANIGLECTTKNPMARQVASWQCTSGYCAVATCTSSHGDCDGLPATGCEVDTSLDPANCGACGSVCNATNGSPYCAGGACKIACNVGYGNCNGTPNDGCETKTSTDPNNCGSCGTVCSSANGTTTCVSGACVPVCGAGYGNCDGNPNNGCETNLKTSTSSCGACGASCANPHGTTSCVSGACAPVCSAGSMDCDGNSRNGCETVTANDPNNCGGCGVKCINANGVTSCVNGACAPVCAAGTADCDGNPNNGCETDTNTSAINCGACGVKCSNPNGTTSCGAGVCAPVCANGYASCDGNLSNGCETNIKTSLTNCGACGATCTNANGTTSCLSGSCTPSCSAGFGDCDGSTANGCETNLDTSTSNCGACGKQCTNLNGTTSCVSGSCSPSCSSGFASCDSNPDNGCETNTNTDVNNCGTCGHKCTNPNGSVSCSSGTCQIGCSPGYADCDGNAANGCETHITSDVSNCGGCGIQCVNPAGSTSCIASACVPLCQAGYGSCDGNAVNGCETNLTTSVNNCGGCGFQCTNAHGTTSCSGASCVPACASGWADCDGNPANGCETNLNTSTNNCGACGNQCTNAHGTTNCVGSICSPSCSSGYASCDGNATNGCETNTTNNLQNCGSCGAQCVTPAHATGTACQASSCNVTTCASGYYNQNGVFLDGCECQADAVSNSCASAQNLGTVTINGAGTVSGNIVPSTDSDWYKITFQTGATCSYNPAISLVTNGNPVAMQVVKSCGGSGLTCLEGGSSSAGNYTSWAFTYSATCGDLKAIDPTPATGPFIKSTSIPVPTVLYVRVFATGSSSSCMPYTLQYSN